MNYNHTALRLRRNMRNMLYIIAKLYRNEEFVQKNKYFTFF